MKASEIVANLNGILEVQKSEEMYFNENKKNKFSSGIAISIAKNRKLLLEEYERIAEIERKNQEIAKKQKIDISVLKEQKELLETEIEVSIKKIKEEDLLGCDISSKDVSNLMFMIE